MTFAGYDNPDDLQEVLQEIFLLVLGKGARRGYNGLTSFKSYILAISKNVVLGRFRKDVKRLERFRLESGPDEVEGYIDEQGLELLVSNQASPDGDYFLQRIRKVVQKCAAGLSLEQREVLRLYYLNELSQDATAAALSINRNKVRKHIQSIRKRLLRELQKHDLHDEGTISLVSVEEKK